MIAFSQTKRKVKAGFGVVPGLLCFLRGTRTAILSSQGRSALGINTEGFTDVARLLLQVRNSRSKVREVQQSRFAEPSLHDMMEEDADMDYTATDAHAWGGLVKNDSLAHEQDNVSSSTTVPGMGHGNVHHNHCGNHRHDGGVNTMHRHCASVATSQ